MREHASVNPARAIKLADCPLRSHRQARAIRNVAVDLVAASARITPSHFLKLRVCIALDFTNLSRVDIAEHFVLHIAPQCPNRPGECHKGLMRHPVSRAAEHCSGLWCNQAAIRPKRVESID